jgi:hypothetical protein
MPISISPALVVCMVAGTATWSTHVLAQSEGGTDSSEPRTMQSAQAGMFLPYSIAPAPTASGRSRSCSAVTTRRASTDSSRGRLTSRCSVRSRRALACFTDRAAIACALRPVCGYRRSRRTPAHRSYEHPFTATATAPVSCEVT